MTKQKSNSYYILCSKGVVSNLQTIDGIETVIINNKNPMLFTGKQAAEKMIEYLSKTSNDVFRTKRFTRS